MADWRQWAVAGVIGVLVILGLFALPHLGTLIDGAMLLNTGLLIRTVCYTVMVGCSFALAIIALGNGFGKLGALFGLFCVAHFVAIILTLLSLYKAPPFYTEWVRSILTPVTVGQSIVYTLLVLDFVRGRKATAINE